MFELGIGQTHTRSDSSAAISSRDCNSKDTVPTERDDVILEDCIYIPLTLYGITF